MNILIIEDDLFLARNIEKLFLKKVITNRIKIISTYRELSFELNIINSYDIILVDIYLGEKENKNGIDLISIIREKNKFVPIIVISAFDDLSYLQLAFSIGACDYIVKPFRLAELQIRVLKWFSIYLYSDKSTNKNLSYFGLEYDLSKNEFFYMGRPINLTKSNKYLLSLFLSNPEKLLSENFLIEKVYGDISFCIDRNLRVNISRLKLALSEYDISNWICNIRAEGYKLKKIV